MEALVAVGLAGNIVQFVEFSCKFTKEAHSIWKIGSLNSLQNLKDLTVNLIRQAEIIKKCLASANFTPMERLENQHLLANTEDCLKAAHEFLSYINSIMGKFKTSTRLRSIGRAIKFQFQYTYIQEFSERLERLKSSLILATLLAVRSTAQENHAQIIEHLRKLQTEHNIGNTKINPLIERTNPKLIERPNSTQNVTEDRLDDCYQTLTSARDELALNRREKEMLIWLNFRQKEWRYEEVPLAYQTTYNWIFDTNRQQSPGTNFSEFLVGSECKPFFINGKAGSGKSTLMKYIIRDRRTQQHLETWAAVDERELVVAQFFFWNVGTSLQKSSAGLLRALLYDVVKNHGELLPAVFAGVHQNWFDGSIQQDPTYFELKCAWEILLERSKSFLNIALFIDGIDEFEGDHSDLASFIRSLAAPQVKVIVSSRPIQAALQTFHDCPSLRLQDLTMSDMETYVKGTLSAHEIMRHFTTCHPEDAVAIVNEIREKADGVFLWVKLVVRSLVKGLEEGDDADDLRSRLRSLPSDLRELYRQMMSKMSKEHQSQAAMMFRIVQTWKKVADQQLCSLLLHFAMQSPENGLQYSRGHWGHEELALTFRQCKARIISRCCGLLETIQGPEPVIEHKIKIDTPASMVVLRTHVTNCSVEYLHRTVEEFLRSDDVSLEIQGLLDATFQPAVHIMGACLMFIKAATNPEIFQVQSLPITVFFSCYRSAQPHERKRLNKYIIELDQVLTARKNKDSRPCKLDSQARPESRQYGVGDYIHKNKDSYYTIDPRLSILERPDGHWSRNYGVASYVFLRSPSYLKRFSSEDGEVWIAETASLLTLTTSFGLVEFLSDFRQECVRDALILIVYAIYSWRDVADSLTGSGLITSHFEDRFDTFMFLLDCIADHRDPKAQQDVFDEIRDVLPISGEEEAILLASCIVTAHEPKPMVGKIPGVFLQNMILGLAKRRFEPRLQTLSRRLAEIVEKIERNKEA